jgi:hypothetical protein
MQPTENQPRITETRIAALLTREAERCRALMERDYSCLAGMLHEALVHAHSSGEVHDKASYLQHAAGPGRLLNVQRGPLALRVHGDVGLMTGTLSQTMQPPAPIAAVTVHTHVTQVWLHAGGDWCLLAFQATRLSQPPVPAPQ